jgi:hypothetical protein
MLGTFSNIPRLEYGGEKKKRGRKKKARLFSEKNFNYNIGSNSWTLTSEFISL